MHNIPITLYIHYPWCESKCPYCDFNSHTTMVDEKYIDVLIDDIKSSLKYINNRTISAIFIGGGTPSLMSIANIDKLFNALNKYFSFTDKIEITIESNPSSAETDKFKFYKSVGINRLSIGVQSFNDKYLKFLGRVHSSFEAQKAILSATNIFDNVNTDIIFGLKNQTIAEVIKDVKTAISFKPQHISFYQLTIEPNTYFAKYTPNLPSDENLYQMMDAGINILTSNNYPRYEVSAFGKISQHNLNYWQFGDYIGIGAGAHGKITLDGKIFRTVKNKKPQDYIIDNKSKISHIDNLSFDFMLNTLRLKNGFDTELFKQRTAQDLMVIEDILIKAKSLGLITIDKKITPTEFGFNHLNSLQELFL